MNRPITVILAAITALSAMAQLNPADYPDLELDHDYTLEYMKSFKGKYTPSESGQIVEYGAVPVYLQDGTEVNTDYAGYINGKQAYQFAAVAGTTYFFKQDFVMIEGTFSIALNPQVRLLNVSPEINTLYDPAANAYVEMIFNQNISIGRTVLTVGDNLYADIDIITGGSTVSVDLNPQLQKWYDQDLIKGGEPLVVTFSDIKDGIGNPLENLTYNFIAAKKPNTLLNAQIPASISSWYTQSSADSRAVFTFSGPMAPAQTVQLCYAPVEIGYEYIEDLPVAVDGNTVTVDLFGKLRTSAIMSAEGRQDTNIYLRLLSMKDADGQMIWSTGQGTIGSFTFSTAFAEIPRLDITSEFTPANGATLNGLSQVKIYFNCADHISYTGVTFTSGDESVTVPAGQIVVDRISPSEVELTVQIPQGWDEKKNVAITLAEVTTDDGYDHSADIAAKYNGFVVTYSSIRNGQAVKSLEAGQLIKADTNLPDGISLACSIADGDGQVIYGPEIMTQGVAGSFTHQMSQSLYFDLGKSYSLLFATSQGDVEQIPFVGATAPYEYSAVHFVSITPEEGTTLDDGQAITVTFDGLAMVQPLDGSAPFAPVPVGDDTTDGYSTIWQLTLTADTPAEQTILFAVTDMDDITVEGNQGRAAASYFTFTYRFADSAIESVTAPSAVHTVYDLQGRPLAQPRRGLNIVNGRIVRL